MKKIIIVLALGLLSWDASGELLPKCGDFLQQEGNKPAQLTFIKCEQARIYDNVLTVTASYHVEGKSIATIERWMMRYGHTKKLKYACCGWESGPGYIRSKDGGSYEIEMGGETVISSRKDWKKIPYLVVTVSRSTDP